MSADLLNAQAGAFEALVACTLAPDVDGATYTLSVVDQATGVILGRRQLPGKPDGSPPEVTLAEALSMIGGAYRIGTVRLDLTCKLVAISTRRLSKWSRRRRRAIALARLRRSAADIARPI